MARRPGTDRPFVIATVVYAGLLWGQWMMPWETHKGTPWPVWGCAILAANLVLTIASPRWKRLLVRLLQKYVINPPVRLLLHAGVMPLGYALLETRGRRSGKPRRTPVGNGRVGDVFWIIAEHGERAGYVRNIRHDPAVRVRMRRGLRFRWVTGIAEVLPDDDPWTRQRELSRWHPLRALNAVVVQVMSADPVVVRIRLTAPTHQTTTATAATAATAATRQPAPARAGR